MVGARAFLRLSRLGDPEVLCDGNVGHDRGRLEVLHGNICIDLYEVNLGEKLSEWHSWYWHSCQALHQQTC